MSIWTKIVLSLVLLGLLMAGTAFWMDLYGIRGGCFASGLDPARFEAARDLLGQADGAVASRNYAAASDMLDLGLDRLGDSYRLGRARDDTGEMVAAAKAAAANSQMEVAARLKQEALRRRAGLMQRKMRLSEVCRQVARRWGLE